MPDDPELRIPPLPESEWDPSLSSIRSGLQPVLNVHRVMANHPELLEAWSPIRNHIATGGSLRPRHRELIILRVAHRAGSEYEWHHHVLRGRAVGLADHEIEALRGATPVGTSEDETSLLVATDELFDGLSLSDSTWGALRVGFSVEQILDVIVTVGVYVTLAMVIGATGMSIEP